MIRSILGIPSGVQSRNDRLQLALLFLIRISLIVAVIWAAYARDWENVGVSVLAMASTYVPAFLERRYRVFLPIEFHLIIVAFLYGSLFLGEVGDAYERFWWWDVMLHTSSGVALGFVGFLILYILQVQGRLKMTPALIGFFSFCVALAGGAVWEIAEFCIDTFFGGYMQKNGTDTMRDLIVDALGALFIVFAANSYLKRVHRSPIAGLIAAFIELNPQLFKNRSAK